MAEGGRHRLKRPLLPRRPAILLIALLAGCRVPRPPAMAVVHEAKRYVASNVTRADYAGSAACATCHAKITAEWDRSPMHRMTRDVKPAEVRAPFDGRTFRYKDDEVRVEQRGAERFMRLATKESVHLYRVTRVIGGRTREDFAGLEVGSYEPDGKILGGAEEELILPVSWIFATASFRSKGYSVMSTERPGLRAGPSWNRTCLFCHNTVPLLSLLYRRLPGSGPGYQGADADALLPVERRAAIEVADERLLEEALTAEIRFLGGEALEPEALTRPDPLVRQAIVTTRDRFKGRHLVEVGIGCEACHGGSAAHAAEPSLSPSVSARSPFLKSRAADGPQDVTRLCARCHQVLFSRYPWTWEGGARATSPGGSHINSGEARDFLLGGCNGAMTCTACHDPHGEDSKEKLAALATPAGNHVCTACHGKYAASEALKKHAKHEPTGAGGSCVACHMPRKNMGLSYDLTRYHRIGSPTDVARVEGDRPLECALCHAGRSAAQLLGDLERLWGKRYDAAKLTALYGDLAKPVLLQTLERGKPHEQATAMALLGESRVKEARGLVAAQVTHAYPLLRRYAVKALGEIEGRPCGVNLDQENEALRKELAAWLEGK